MEIVTVLSVETQMAASTEITDNRVDLTVDRVASIEMELVAASIADQAASTETMDSRVDLIVVKAASIADREDLLAEQGVQDLADLVQADLQILQRLQETRLRLKSSLRAKNKFIIEKIKKISLTRKNFIRTKSMIQLRQALFQRKLKSWKQFPFQILPAK